MRPAPKRVMKVSRPGSVVGVEPGREGQRVVRRRGRAELDADRVADPAHQLDVRAVQLARALTDPEEVRRDVVRQLGARVDAGQRVLVLQHERLVGGVEVDPVELVGIGADRLHELHGAVDLVGQLLVGLSGHGVAHEVGVPGVHLPQVGVAAGDEGAHEVERGGRGVVDVDESLRVVSARLGCELVAVDGIAAIGRQRHAVAGLGVGRARLGVLPGDPAELDHRHGRGVRQHDRHLQQHPQLVAHVVGRDPGEGLGAVAALEEERLAARDRRELLGQLVALPREDQRRHRAQPADGGVDRGTVGVRRLLGRAECAQRIEVGDLAHQPSVRSRVPDSVPEPAAWDNRHQWADSP